MLAVTAAALSVAVGGGCAPSAAPPASAGNTGVYINTKTPPGLRAKQTLDMLNSDWPIGPVSVGTLATADRVDEVVETMESLWWDRPYSVGVDGVDVRAGAATLHLIASYGARQDIDIHTDDDGLVDRFEVSTRKPKIRSWRDVEDTLAKTGARYSDRKSVV